MARKRKKSSGTKMCECSTCGMVDPSTVPETKHRRCGGAQGAPRREKHAASTGARGKWV